VHALKRQPMVTVCLSMGCAAKMAGRSVFGRPAIVLGLGVTGLATSRALSAHGIAVSAAYFSPEEPGRFSRKCRVVDGIGQDKDANTLSRWLYQYSEQVGGAPVVFPTSDALALMLAEKRESLSQVCELWHNDLHHLESLVRKDRLYRLAASAGIQVPPTQISPRVEELRRWCRQTPGPYLVKPYYARCPTSNFHDKNRTFESSDDLLAFVDNRGNSAAGLIVQRILLGGDGSIYDCYGLCDRDGCVRAMATHRRIRQHPPNFGITCYGEIPACPPGVSQASLFALTVRLFGLTRYHGIFGVEWLQDKATRQMYLLDVNARPFYTIGHLHDCGVNLPLLAYQDLCGHDVSVLEFAPRVRHVYWVDLINDWASRTRRSPRLGVGRWLLSLIRCGSYALWCIRDPLPALWASLASLLRVLKKRFRKSLTR
jgi:D-aspartate ligase